MSRRVGPKYRPTARASARGVASTAAQRARVKAAARQFGRRPSVATVRRMSELMGVEKKFYDTALSASNIGAPTDATGGEFDPSATSMISTPAVGDGEQNRDGKRIMIESVQLKGVLNMPGSEAQADTRAATKVFVALVLDTQTNGAQLNSEDVFKNTNAAALTAATPMRNLLFANRFRVLRSDVFDITPKSLSQNAVNDFSYNAEMATFDWFVPLNLPVNFNAGTTASVANVVDNSLHVIAYCTNVNGTPTISYNARIRFQG